MNVKHILNVETLEELKREYKRLAFIFHPDCGGNTKTMQEINNEYDYLFATLKNTHKNKDGEFYQKENTSETPDEWKNLIFKLFSLKMVNTIIEVIGSFLWVSGETKPYKDQLKTLGFKWSTNKSAWYIAPTNYKKRSRQVYEMNDIRNMYGTTEVKQKNLCALK